MTYVAGHGMHAASRIGIAVPLLPVVLFFLLWCLLFGLPWLFLHSSSIGALSMFSFSRLRTCTWKILNPRPREHKEAVANYARGFAASDPAMVSHKSSTIQCMAVIQSSGTLIKPYLMYAWSFFRGIDFMSYVFPVLWFSVIDTLMFLSGFPSSETLNSNISNTPAANPHRHGPWLHHLDVIQGDAEVGSVMGILDLLVKNRKVVDLL